MKTEEIIDRLRNPQKYNKMPVTLQKREMDDVEITAPKGRPLSTMLALGIGGCVFGMAAIVLIAMLNAKDRAENLTEALNPKEVAGLAYNADFNPNKSVTYVQIYEGQDRNVAVDELGTTLPIISRYNYQAITPKNYGVIGAAPWALTSNFEANLTDVEILRYLLNRAEVSDAFVLRPDVAPLLEDPQLLAAFAQDSNTLQAFFNSEVVQHILASEALVRTVAGSRFMSKLLTSKAVKYYRDHPQEASKLINASPVLGSLKQNPAVRKAVEENYYLKSIAPQLLASSVQAQSASSVKTATTTASKKKKKK